MDKARLKEIFIEEASEIIEKLDVEIINLEERPGDKNLLNEFFRGVHTLKGSANSFGFMRLGVFVHGLEDVLDYYRTSSEPPKSHVIDIFLQSVDVIKEIFDYEMKEQEGLPEKYDACINSFKQLLSGGAVDSSFSVKPTTEEPMRDLASEFGDLSGFSMNAELDEIEKKILEMLDSSSKFYKITLCTDEDLYLRGQDHALFLRLLANEGEIIYSHWDMSNVPKLSFMEADSSYIREITIYLKSHAEMSEIADIFSFLEEHEYRLEILKQESANDNLEKNTGDKEADSSIQSENLDANHGFSNSLKSVNATDEELDSSCGASSAVTKMLKTQKSEISTIQKETKRSFVKIDTAKLDELFDSIGELVIAQNFLAENEEIKLLKGNNLGKNIETLSKITRLIQNRVMSLRMVPIKDTFERMRRVARDASKKVGKEIKLQFVGEETEIDKNMVDALSDPLIHIIRNAIDHGIEDSSEQRLALGKPEIGTVELKAYHRGGNIVIEITDDGRGISRERVYQKALERGLITPSDELSDSQVYSLILQAGFSTAEKVSDVSGRGVGLDVVRSSIEAMRGRVEIESINGQGSSFAMFLPLTLAIIDGMLVKSDGETFIIPTLSIIESFRPSEDIVHTVQGDGEFVNLREELLPIVRLNHVLEIGSSTPKASESILMCVESERGRFAILIDELLGRRQVVIKTLGKTFAHLREISGGAVLGNGEIALILNIDELN
ncbi:MAG: chemotaxis protein CheA [Wolinella sp.]